MKLLSDYFDLEKQIHEYFGYKENWRVIPLDDSTKYVWRYDEGDNEVYFADSIKELETEKGNFYSNEIYTQRHLRKWVYRGADYTMMCVDTRTDGNKFLQIFDNKKEVKCSK